MAVANHAHNAQYNILNISSFLTTQKFALSRATFTVITHMQNRSQTPLKIESLMRKSYLQQYIRVNRAITRPGNCIYIWKIHQPVRPRDLGSVEAGSCLYIGGPARFPYDNKGGNLA
jgi:hypothetical protein